MNTLPCTIVVLVRAHLAPGQLWRAITTTTITTTNQPHQALEGDLLDHITPRTGTCWSHGRARRLDGLHAYAPRSHGRHEPHAPSCHQHAHAHGLQSHMSCMSDVDADPRDLEAFAERFNTASDQTRRDPSGCRVSAGQPEDPGVGSLSQSTICRFESLTLSHNNMIALKPILQPGWRRLNSRTGRNLNKPELFNGARRRGSGPPSRPPEKRSLEAYFAIQPRSVLRENRSNRRELDLKKNVVRFGFATRGRNKTHEILGLHLARPEDQRDVFERLLKLFRDDCKIFLISHLFPIINNLCIDPEFHDIQNETFENTKSLSRNYAKGMWNHLKDRLTDQVRPFVFPHLF